jgi:hypothetical protein
VKDNNSVRIYIDGVESTGSYVSGAAPMDNNTAGDAFRFGGMYLHIPEHTHPLIPGELGLLKQQ